MNLPSPEEPDDIAEFVPDGPAMPKISQVEIVILELAKRPATTSFVGGARGS